MNQRLSTATLYVLLLPGVALAEVPIAATAEVPVPLDAIVVRGTLPAPGLWTLARGGKRVFVMGTLLPAPAKMRWHSPHVEERVAEAQVVLQAPVVSITSDIGLFRSLWLWPAYNQSRRNPDGQRLKDVLPPETYARWQAAKRRHLGGDGKVDALRPVHAASELFDAATRQAGLTQQDRVDDAIGKIAKRRSIPVFSTAFRVVVKDPKQTLRTLRSAKLEDVLCLEQTLDRLDVDLHTMVLRANAWAEGDMGQLRELPFTDQKDACIRAWSSSEIARQQGIDDLDGDVRAHWLDVLREQLETHDVVFATMPIARLEGADGILAALRDEGFVISAPE